MHKNTTTQSYEYIFEMIRFFRNALISVFVFLGLIAYKLHSLAWIELAKAEREDVNRRIQTDEKQEQQARRDE